MHDAYAGGGGGQCHNGLGYAASPALRKFFKTVASLMKKKKFLTPKLSEPSKGNGLAGANDCLNNRSASAICTPTY